MATNNFNRLDLLGGVWGAVPLNVYKITFFYGRETLIDERKSMKIQEIKLFLKRQSYRCGKDRVLRPVHTNPLGLRPVPVVWQEEPSSC